MNSENPNVIKIQKLAKIICEVATNYADIEFSSRGKGSFCMSIFQKQKKKFDIKKFMCYSRIWNSNYLDIQNIVKGILNIQTSTIINIEKTQPLNKENNVVEYEEDNYCSNIKLHVNNKTVDDKTSCNIFATSRRYETQENEIHLINDVDYIPSSNSSSSHSRNNSDSSIKHPHQQSKLSVQKKFNILQGRFYVQRTIIFDQYQNVDKNKIRDKIQRNMVDKLNFLCRLKFYGGIRHNANCLVTYANCRYSSHVQQFKFNISNIDDAIINIFVSSTKCDETLHEGRPIMCDFKR